MNINITKEQFCEIGKLYQSYYDKMDEVCEKLDYVSPHLGDFIVDVTEPFYEFLHKALAVVDKKMYDWIDWFVFETHFGTNEDMTEVTVTPPYKSENNSYNITSWEALYDFLMAEYDTEINDDVCTD